MESVFKEKESKLYQSLLFNHSIEVDNAYRDGRASVENAIDEWEREKRVENMVLENTQLKERIADLIIKIDKLTKIKKRGA